MATFTMFGQTVTETTAKAEIATITPELAEMFANIVTHLSDKPNTHVMSFELPDDKGDPETFRLMIQQYAKEHDLAYGLPKHVGEHMSKDVVDPDTGKVTKKGKLIPDNGKPAHWNVGRNITFRFSPHTEKSNGGASSKVTVTSTDDASDAE